MCVRFWNGNPKTSSGMNKKKGEFTWQTAENFI